MGFFKLTLYTKLKTFFTPRNKEGMHMNLACVSKYKIYCGSKSVYLPLVSVAHSFGFIKYLLMLKSNVEGAFC